MGKSYKLKQSNCGHISHVGNLKYAYDFFTGEGETITASRAGTVWGVKEDEPDGPSTSGRLNYVVIGHEYGTIGRYMHIQQNGAQVKEGEVVERGQEIALSGSSGVPAGIPTLHFDVMKQSGEGMYDTSIPVTFINADPPAPTATGLDVDVTYTALAY